LAAIIKQLFIPFSADKKLYYSLRNILGFYPTNIALYKQAFRHSSVAHEIKEGVKDSNERLEYLGDAILSAIIAHHLFTLFPFKDEGFLTKMRSKLVSRMQLNQLSVKLGLNKLIDSNLEASYNSSVNGDAFEALIGAIYLDKGYNTTYHFIRTRIIQYHIDMDAVETKETDFKSKLIEWAQKEKHEVKFVVATELGTGYQKQFVIDVVIDGEVIAKAQHYVKKKAEQYAAEQALLLITSNS